MSRFGDRGKRNGLRDNWPSLLALLALGVLLAASGCTASWSSDQGKTISPDGSSYSYKVPHGFLIEDTSEAVSTPWKQYKTGVFIPTESVEIRVREQPLPGTMVANTPSTIQKAFIAEASRWPHPATNWRHTSAAGAPALRYHLSGQTLGGKRQDAEEVAVFSGQHIVYVSCNWVDKSKKDLALRGCKDVLKSLRIVKTSADA